MIPVSSPAAAGVRIASAEFLALDPVSPRSAVLFAALAKAAARASIQTQMTKAYHGGADLLCLWGPGHPTRLEPMRAQAAGGGHVVAWDLAYWNRERKIRCAIDGAHPDRWVMRRAWPMQRFEADAPRVARLHDPRGPVILAGIGAKAKVQYGAETVEAWEAAQAAECARRGRRVLYRRKNGIGVVPEGVTATAEGPIERVIAGASLVMTWHSNVAVDAIRLGIPVVCREGAARAVCAASLPAEGWPAPLATDVRDRFLWNLAWFQWAPTEAAAFWAWLPEILAA